MVHTVTHMLLRHTVVSQHCVRGQRHHGQPLAQAEYPLQCQQLASITINSCAHQHGRSLHCWHTRLPSIAHLSRQRGRMHAWSEDPHNGRGRESLSATTFKAPCCTLFNTIPSGPPVGTQHPCTCPSSTIKGRTHAIQRDMLSQVHRLKPSAIELSSGRRVLRSGGLNHSKSSCIVVFHHLLRLTLDNLLVLRISRMLSATRLEFTFESTDTVLCV